MTKYYDPQAVIGGLQNSIRNLQCPQTNSDVVAVWTAAHRIMTAYINLHNATVEFGQVFCEDVPSWNRHGLKDRVGPAFRKMMDNTNFSYTTTEPK